LSRAWPSSAKKPGGGASGISFLSRLGVKHLTPSLYEPLSVGTDGSGVLFFSELDFSANRIYWLTGPSLNRGGHAHKKLRQSFICVAGKVSVVLTDGSAREVVNLKAGQAVTIAPGLWRDINPLREGDVLLAIASDAFDEDDYIRDFLKFKEWKSA
jgi:mannose-6-phosphate isomerase-like protein (cupin superfamily)